MSKFRMPVWLILLFILLCAQLYAQPLTSTPVSLDFGDVELGNSPIEILHISAITPPVTINTAFLTGDTAFTINYMPIMPFTIASTYPMNMDIGFNPTVTGAVTAILWIVPSVGDPLEVPLSGTGIPVPPPMLTVSADYDFGNVAVDDSSFHDISVQLTPAWIALNSVGGVDSIQVDGSSAFSIVEITNVSSGTAISLPKILHDGDVINVRTRFIPISAGIAGAFVRIYADDGKMYRTELIGTGISHAPHIDLNPDSFIMGLGEGSSKTGIFQIQNTGLDDLTFDIDATDLPPWISLGTITGTVAGEAAQDITVFADADTVAAGNYSYIVQIMSNDIDNPSVSLMITIEVDAVPLLANFTAEPLSGTAPLLVQFIDSSHSDPTTGWISISSRQWDFNNDGVIDSYALDPTYIYTQPGLYTVRLVVTSNTGLTSTKIRSDYISIENHAPIVVAPLATIPGMLEDTVWGPTDITSIFNDPDGDSLVYTCAGSTNITATLASGYLTLSPAANWFGSEIMVIKATDPFGLFAENTVVVSVASVNDAPVLSVPSDLYFIRNSTFRVDFSNYIHDPDNPDAQLSMQIQTAAPVPVINFAYSPINSPNVMGQHGVHFTSLSQNAVQQNFSITVTDNRGRAIASADFTVHVLEHFVPQINLADIYQFAGQTVQFSDATLGNPDHWLWEFGTGATSTLQNPSYQYLNAGTYDIRLTLGNSEVPTEDRQIFIPAMIHLTGTAVTDDSVPSTWTPQGSPYNLFGDVVITDAVVIQENVEVNLFGELPLQIEGTLNATGVVFQPQSGSGFWGGLLFRGSRLREPSELQNCELIDALNPITVEGDSPLLNNLYIAVSDTTSLASGVAVSITGASTAVLSNTEILNYRGGVVIDTDGDTRTTPTITNIRIRNSSSSIRRETDAVDTGLTLKSTATLNNVELDNYGSGLLITSPDTRTTSSPTLTNIRIRNSNSTVRSVTTGLTISGNTAPQLTQIDIQDCSLAMLIDGVNPASRTTPTLTNIRIRNSNSTVRSLRRGISLRNTADISFVDVHVDSCSTGISMEADTRTTSTPTLTNIRIRNSLSSIRNDGNGMVISGAVYPRITDLEIDDYNTGLRYTQDSALRIEATPTITNIRIRNSSSSVRQLHTGAEFNGLAKLSLSDLDVTDYGTGLKINASPAAACNPTLSDIYVRNANMRIEQNTGIYLGSGVTGSLKNSKVKQAAIGILIADGNRTVLENNTIMNCNTGIKAAGSNPLPIKKQLFVLEDAYFGPHSAEEFCAMELSGNGPWNVYQNTIFDYPKGLRLFNASLNFHSNIMWTDSHDLQAFINSNSSINSIYNDIYTPLGSYPGPLNISLDPRFISVAGMDFSMHRDSPCIDAGNPAFAPDPDGSVADMGAFVYLHSATGIASPRFVVTGSSVHFANTSLGHNYPDTNVQWNIGNDGSVESTSREFDWVFTNPGIYSVSLNMQSGLLEDTTVYPALVVVSSNALLAPQNPSLNVEASNVHLAWEPVTQTLEGLPIVVNNYIVYKADRPDGFFGFCGLVDAPQSSYIDVEGAMQNRAFYIVLGFAGTREELNQYIEENRSIRTK